MTREQRGQESAELGDLARRLMLRLEQPTDSKGKIEAFTPQAIRTMYPGIYGDIVAILSKRQVGEKVWRDWDPFYKVLKAKYPAWAKRWETPERKREQALSRHAAAIVQKLRTAKWTGQLSPGEIAPMYGNYEHLLSLLPEKKASRGKRHERDWSEVVSRLEEFATLWEDRETRKQRSLAKAVEELVVWLEKTNPDTISPGKLRDENPELFNKIAIRCRVVKRKTDWSLLEEHPLFPQKWRERWQSRRSGKFYQEDLALIRRALEEKKPEVFDPEWLRDNLGIAIHHRIFRRLPRPYGSADWEKFIKALDQDQPPEARWRERWRVEKIGQKAQRAVQAILDTEREHLATFVRAEKPVDIKKRDEIINIFVGLAQQGNGEAQKTLRELFTSIIQGWAAVDRDIAFSATTDPEDAGTLEQVFARCVATYKFGQGQTFLEFFHDSLKRVAQVAHGREGTRF